MQQEHPLRPLLSSSRLSLCSRQGRVFFPFSPIAQGDARRRSRAGGEHPRSSAEDAKKHSIVRLPFPGDSGSHHAMLWGIPMVARQDRGWMWVLSSETGWG